MIQGFGALPDSVMKELILDGNITGVSEDCINPASFDLALSEEAYRMSCSVLPRDGQMVADLLAIVNAKRIDVERTIFEPGVTYCFRTPAGINLPRGCYAHFNPKSSTGRDGWLVRAIVDGVGVYDALPAELSATKHTTPWLLATPTKMPIEMSVGETLAQARIFNKDTRLSVHDLRLVHDVGNSPLLFMDGKPVPWELVHKFESEKAIGVTLNLRPGEKIGYRCRENRMIVDYRKVQPTDVYFEPVYADSAGNLLLESGYFYILCTMEGVCVPPWLACELVPTHAWLGEVRIHAAGYIDPGWGYEADGKSSGGNITLEVWPQENLYIQKGQLVGLLKYETMTAPPSVDYNQKMTSHYKGQQSAKPSKRFV